MDIEIVELQQRSPELVAALVGIWERSVRVTHDFLEESDIVGMRPEVSEALVAIENLAVAQEVDGAVGFAASQDNKLEMLFITPEVRGCGIGTKLLVHAVEHWRVCRIDVNEQNPQARSFYERQGFVMMGRSASDGAGRPFPLVHLVRTEGVRT